MKQQLWVGAALCVVTLILTYGFNALTERVEVTNGRVTVGSPITLFGGVVSEVEIDNWNSKQLDGLILVVPTSVSLPSITSSFPINIEEVKGVSGSQSLKRISFGGIPPHHLVRVTIPLTTIRDVDSFHLPNVELLNLETRWNDYSDDPVKRENKTALFNAVVFTMYVALVVFIFYRVATAMVKKAESDYDKRRAEDKSKMDAFEERFEKAKTDNEKIRKEVMDSRRYYLRVRLLLLARISDYNKELDFWRNTVRKVVVAEGLGKSQAETILNNVTSTLQTYGTRGDLVDNFDSIMVAARLLSKQTVAESDEVV